MANANLPLGILTGVDSSSAWGTRTPPNLPAKGSQPNLIREPVTGGASHAAGRGKLLAEGGKSPVTGSGWGHGELERETGA